jgi:hypothetical protein
VRLDQQRERVRDAIVDHLRKHPDASDTSDGILMWWLPAAMQQDPALVEDALDELVTGGVMRRRNLPDGGVLFSAARPRRH